MDDRTLRVRLVAEVQSYLDGMRQASAATSTFSKNVSGHGTAVKADIEKMGRGAMLMAGGMTLALGASAKAAMDWESSWVGVQKTVDGSASEMAQLEEGLRGLAKTLPATHEEIAGVAEAAGQLGVARADIVGFTETMVALGVSTNLSSEEAATSLAQMMNIMQTAPADVERLGSTLVALGNAARSTERDILEMSLRLAGAGRLIGASEAEVLALANAMASVGIEAQLGGGAMSRAMAKIYAAVSDGGDALKDFAKVAGLSAKDFADKFRADPIQAVDLFVKGLARVKAEGGNVVQVLADVGLKGTQDRDVLLRLAGAGDELTDSLRLGSEEWERNRALQDEAAKRYGTTAAQMQVMKNQATDLAIQVGDALLPAIKLVVGGLTEMFDVIGSLPGPLIAVGTGMAVLSTAGLAAVGIIGTLGPKVREADIALKAMGLGSNFASQNLGRFATAAAKTGLVVGVLYGVGQALDAAFDEDTHGNITKIENDLLKLGQGTALASLNLDLGTLSDSLERIADPSVGTQVAHTANEVFTLGGVLGKSTDKLQDAKDRVDGLDQALASLAQKDPKAAAAALEALKAALGPEDFDRLLPLLDDYEVSLTALDTAGRTGAGGIEEVTNAAGVSEQAISDLADEIDALFGAMFGTEAAADAFQQGLNDLDEVVRQAIEDGLDLNDVLTSQSDGALTLRGSMRDLANDAAEVIQTWVEQGIQGDELTVRIAGLSQSFRDQAIAAGVPAPVVDHYLALLAAIPASVPTEITVSVDSESAEQALARIGARLASFGIKGTAGAYYLAPGTQGPVLPLPQGPIPGRAAGGPVRAGQSYMVGERGPELVTVGASGYVHDAMSTRQMMAGGMFTGGGGYGPAPTTAGSGGAPTFIVNLQVEGSVHSKESLVQEVTQGIRRVIRTEAGGDVQRGLGQ